MHRDGVQTHRQPQQLAKINCVRLRPLLLFPLAVTGSSTAFDRLRLSRQHSATAAAAFHEGASASNGGHRPSFSFQPGSPFSAVREGQHSQLTGKTVYASTRASGGVLPEPAAAEVQQSSDVQGAHPEGENDASMSNTEARHRGHGSPSPGSDPVFMASAPFMSSTWSQEPLPWRQEDDDGADGGESTSSKTSATSSSVSEWSLPSSRSTIQSGPRRAARAGDRAASLVDSLRRASTRGLNFLHNSGGKGQNGAQNGGHTFKVAPGSQMPQKPMAKSRSARGFSRFSSLARDMDLGGSK